MNVTKVIALILAISWFVPLEAAQRRQLERQRFVTNGTVGAPSTDSYRRFYQGDISKQRTKKASLLRNRTINSIRKLLSSNVNKRSEFQLRLRLSELLFEKYQVELSSELDGYHQGLDSFYGKKRAVRPNFDNDTSNRILNQAISSYRKIVRRFANHHEIDRIYFALAFALTVAKDSSSKLYFERLIKRFPKSPYVPDAYLALGEYHFERHEMEGAIKNYKAVIPYKKSSAYLFAVYKLGWSYYNRSAKSRRVGDRNNKKALAAFKLVISVSEKHNNVTLRDEALNDIVLIFAEIGNTKPALQYFSKIGEAAYFRKLLKRLAWVYTENGDNRKAIAIFSRLLKRYPLHAENPEILTSAIDAYKKVRDFQAIVTSLQRYEGSFGNDTDWHSRHRKTDVEKNYRTMFEEKAREWATRFHNIGQKKGVSGDRQRKTYKRAYIAYRLYLKHFHKRPEAYQLRYNYAELLFFFKKYPEAAKHYGVIVKEKKNDELMRSSAFNAVVAWQFEFDRLKLRKPKKSTKVREIPKALVAMIAAIDTYIDVVKKGDDVLPLKKKAAQIYFDYGHKSDAISRLYDIATEFPKTEEAVTSVRMIFDLEQRVKNWKGLYQWAVKIEKNKAIGNRKFRRELHSVVMSSHFKMAEVLEKEKKYERAGKLFTAYYKAFPKNKYADDALFKAAVNFKKNYNIEASIERLKVLDLEYKDSKLHPDVLARLATAYEQLMDYNAAAAYYERFGRRYPRQKGAGNALLNAAVIRESLTHREKALTAYGHYIRLFQNDRTFDAMLSAAELALGLSRFDVATQYLQRLAAQNKNRDLKIYSNVKLADIARRHGRGNVAQRHFQNAMRDYKRTKRKSTVTKGSYAIAGYLFVESDKLYKRFMAATLKNPKTLNRDLQRKKQLLAQASARLKEIIAIRAGEFSVASLFRAGKMSQNMSASLMNAANPVGISSKQVAAFRSGLEKIAFPLEEEASGYFKTAYEKAVEFGVYTAYTKLAYLELSKIAPADYPVAGEYTPRTGFVFANFFKNDDIVGMLQ